VRLAGLGLSFELDFGKGLANSSSDDVKLIISDSGTGFGFGFLVFVFELGLVLLALALDGVWVDFVLRERIFARSARDGPYTSSIPIVSTGLNIDVFSMVEGPAPTESDSFRMLLVA
jgi:hypothetical protein